MEETNNRVKVGIDVGTSKICTVVGEVRPDDIYVLGSDVEPSAGMEKGVVTDVNALSAAISRSLYKALRASACENAEHAFVSISGSHISSLTSPGMATIVGPRSIQQEDIDKALEIAQGIAIPHNRQILHVFPRSYTLDGQEGIRNPIGMHCYRLEVDAHIITAPSTSQYNLEDAVETAGIKVSKFILNPLASADAVLTSHEREMGAVVIDIGGGTTDLAIYIDGEVWHTAIIPVGGNHVTRDITYCMRVPFELAEQVKIQRGHADMDAVDESEVFSVEPFGGGRLDVQRREVAMVIQMRCEEIFDLAETEIKRSGYGSLLRAGAVITGGSSHLPGFRDLASRRLNLPVRLAHPENITGMADTLKNPSYSTAVGLLRLGMALEAKDPEIHRYIESPFSRWGRAMNDFLRRFLPQDD